MIAIYALVVFFLPFFAVGQTTRPGLPEEIEERWQRYLNQSNSMVSDCSLISARNFSVELQDFVYSASEDHSTFNYSFSLFNPALGEGSACDTANATLSESGKTWSNICSRRVNLPKRWGFNWTTRELTTRMSWLCPAEPRIGRPQFWSTTRDVVPLECTTGSGLIQCRAPKSVVLTAIQITVITGADEWVDIWDPRERDAYPPPWLN
ncbi:hypothetical protein QBC35DRAFT_451827 [Podospora australis]|uniref:Ecp2 effector protein domain-containing protein n=1 Tax=Podospora australis TaxID=1536484 RepID=A0AAN6WWU6_9PEZI|nr:hypothetical protein QBC35DRAFT_451827 [Podospora australis]